MRRGFSLAEVLVALFLTTVALLALVSTRLYAVQAERGGLERFEMGAAAGSVLASIEADLQKSPDNFSRSYAVSQRPVPDMANVVYSVEEAAPEPGLRKFTVTVAEGDLHFKLWTLVYRP